VGPYSFLFEVSAADLNGDGTIDLAMAMSSAFGNVGNVGVLLGNGDGSFRPWSSFPAPGYVWDVSITHLAGAGQGEVTFLAGPNGSAVDQDALYQLTIGDGGSVLPLLAPDGGTRGFLIGDFNRDGAQDIVLFTSPAPDNTSTIQLYLNGCP
jgi:hypothetical protein